MAIPVEREVAARAAVVWALVSEATGMGERSPEAEPLRWSGPAGACVGRR